MAIFVLPKCNFMYSRTEVMFGAEGMASLRSAHVLVVGCGGVGGAVLEMLARAGIGRLTLVDADCVQASNINRQLIATSSTIGQFKVDVWRRRLLDISPGLQVTTYAEFLEENNTICLLDSQCFDFVVDAIDTVSPKVFLLSQCVARNIPIISSMGSGGKTDPSKIRLADISKTEYCPLAKVVRTRLAALGIRHGIPCVFSTEPADRRFVVPADGEKYKKSTTGTVSYMPNMFGCWIASCLIRRIAGQK